VAIDNQSRSTYAAASDPLLTAQIAAGAAEQ